jgi:hypothetical protein
MTTVRTGARALAGLALAGLVLAGCAAAAGQQAAAAGQVNGRLLMAGGPLGPGGKQPGERPMPGVVTFTGAGNRRVSVRVGSSGTFSMRLAPGRYEVSGRSPDITGAGGQDLPCSVTVAVSVAAGHTATVAVVCPVP